MGKKAKRRAVLRIEVPFTSDPPVLTSDALGLPRLLRRPAASFVMDVTVIDAADGRLLRDGVVVAHRVVGGIGEWYLSAPRWSPHLPEECTRPLGTSGDLPVELAHRLRPLIRGAVLGPIAALRCTRDEWALRDAEGGVAAVVPAGIVSFAPVMPRLPAEEPHSRPPRSSSPPSSADADRPPD